VSEVAQRAFPITMREGMGSPQLARTPTHDPRFAGPSEKSALSLLSALRWLLLSALSRLLLAALSRLLALLARLLLSATALLSALAALVLLAGLLIRVLVHNCSCVSSLATTKPRPLSFLWTLVRKRTSRPSSLELIAVVRYCRAGRFVLADAKAQPELFTQVACCYHADKRRERCHDVEN
jgi:hypothetical protein